MAPQNLRSALQKRPFQSFSIRTASGESYQVSHPEVAWVQPEGEVAIVSVRGPEGPTVVMLDMSSITEVVYNRLQPAGGRPEQPAEGD